MLKVGSPESRRYMELLSWLRCGCRQRCSCWRRPLWLGIGVKFALMRRVELLAVVGPFAHSRAENGTTNGTGDVLLGVQGILHQGEGARPTIALSYFGRVYSGRAPDLDIGSARNSVLLLASADVRGFHYDTNYFFNEVLDNAIHRAQFGQTLSVSHSLARSFGISGEIWHFTQPFLRSNADRKSTRLNSSH